MKLKLDENLPRGAGHELSTGGHDVSTVPAEGLTGSSDAELAAAAAQEGRMLVTLDRGLGDLRAHPPGSHPGILVLRLHDQGAPHVAQTIRRLLAIVELESLEGPIAILEEDRLRIRRPVRPSAP